MTRALVVLSSPELRSKAKRWIDAAPDNTRVEFKKARRSTDQNSRLWAMLTEIAAQVEYYGKKRDAETWKDLFTAAYREIEMLPGLDGRSFVQVGLRTSDMSKEELTGLMQLIETYGVEHGVKFGEKEAA